MKETLIVCILAMAIVKLAEAQEPLTWESCLIEVSKNNPELIAAREQINKAKAEYHGSYNGFLPQLSADAGYAKANSATSVASIGAGSGTRDEYNIGLSARQNIFSGWNDKGGIVRSYAEFEAAEAGLKETGSNVWFDLKSAFVRLLYAQEQVVLTETIAEHRRENFRLVELRYNAGREHKGSFLRSKAAWTQAEFEMSQSKRALRVAQRELAKVLGRSQFEVIVATGSFKTNLPQVIPDFQLLTDKTPAYLQAQAQDSAAKAGVIIAKSQFYPDLTAITSISRRGSEWPPDTDRWSLGLSLSFPFFPGGRNIYDVKSALAGEREAQANLKNTIDNTVLELEEAFAGYQDAVEKTGVQKEFLEAAEVRAEIAKSQYTSGLLSFEDWDLIENDLIANQKAWLLALRDSVIAEAGWEKTQGKGIIQ